ncbi:MAG: hypothetical protein ACRECW_13000 [Phyllobacterium sp.]
MVDIGQSFVHAACCAPLATGVKWIHEKVVPSPKIRVLTDFFQREIDGHIQALFLKYFQSKSEAGDREAWPGMSSIA